MPELFGGIVMDVHLEHVFLNHAEFFFKIVSVSARPWCQAVGVTNRRAWITRPLSIGTLAGEGMGQVNQGPYTEGEMDLGCITLLHKALVISGPFHPPY